MRALVFAKRNLKEIVRDPLSLIFGIGLPAFLLIIFQQFNIPSEVYNINNFAPAVAIFAFGFVTLFSATLISKDRTTSFLTRMFASPMEPKDFILGYTLAMIPVVIFQTVLFFLIAMFLGLNLSINILFTILILIPISLIFIGLGLLIGCITSDKSAPGVSSIIIQLVAFTSGMWFDTSMVGKTFQTICNILPFKYCVDLSKAFLHGNYNNILMPIIVIIISIMIIYLVAVLLFKRKMQGDAK
ncbi:MAG TPA: ABC transporter permease [Bacilli bacterium]|nr:ABC transporter permease [Bacilli bacterium]